jgi:short-subunit dehydrogenase
MNLNVRAPFVLSKEFSKDMVKNNWGRIVNIASSGAYNGLKNTSIYRSSKHALLGLSRSLYNELKEFNVRTFCFSPGPMKTDMGKDIINKENPNEEYETFMQPKEIAEFIVFTISFENNMMSPEIRLGRIK